MSEVGPAKEIANSMLFSAAWALGFVDGASKLKKEQFDLKIRLWNELFFGLSREDQLTCLRQKVKSGLVRNRTIFSHLSVVLMNSACGGETSQFKQLLIIWKLAAGTDKEEFLNQRFVRMRAGETSTCHFMIRNLGSNIRASKVAFNLGLQLRKEIFSGLTKLGKFEMLRDASFVSAKKDVSVFCSLVNEIVNLIRSESSIIKSSSKPEIDIIGRVITLVQLLQDQIADLSADERLVLLASTDLNGRVAYFNLIFAVIALFPPRYQPLGLVKKLYKPISILYEKLTVGIDENNLTKCLVQGIATGENKGESAIGVFAERLCECAKWAFLREPTGYGILFLRNIFRKLSARNQLELLKQPILEEGKQVNTVFGVFVELSANIKPLTWKHTSGSKDDIVEKKDKFEISEMVINRFWKVNWSDEADFWSRIWINLSEEKRVSLLTLTKKSDAEVLKYMSVIVSRIVSIGDCKALDGIVELSSKRFGEMKKEDRLALLKEKISGRFGSGKTIIQYLVNAVKTVVNDKSSERLRQLVKFFLAATKDFAVEDKVKLLIETDGEDDALIAIIVLALKKILKWPVKEMAFPEFTQFWREYFLELTPADRFKVFTQIVVYVNILRWHEKKTVLLKLTRELLGVDDETKFVERFRFWWKLLAGIGKDNLEKVLTVSSEPGAGETVINYLSRRLETAARDNHRKAFVKLVECFNLIFSQMSTEQKIKSLSECDYYGTPFTLIVETLKYTVKRGELEQVQLIRMLLQNALSKTEKKGRLGLISNPPGSKKDPCGTALLILSESLIDAVKLDEVKVLDIVIDLWKTFTAELSANERISLLSEQVKSGPAKGLTIAWWLADPLCEAADKKDQTQFMLLVSLWNSAIAGPKSKKKSHLLKQKHSKSGQTIISLFADLVLYATNTEDKKRLKIVKKLLQNVLSEMTLEDKRIALSTQVLRGVDKGTTPVWSLAAAMCRIAQAGGDEEQFEIVASLWRSVSAVFVCDKVRLNLLNWPSEAGTHKDITVVDILRRTVEHAITCRNMPIIEKAVSMYCAEIWTILKVASPAQQLKIFLHENAFKKMSMLEEMSRVLIKYPRLASLRDVMITVYDAVSKILATKIAESTGKGLDEETALENVAFKKVSRMIDSIRWVKKVDSTKEPVDPSREIVKAPTPKP